MNLYGIIDVQTTGKRCSASQAQAQANYQLDLTMARLTHRFEGRMDDKMFKALDQYVDESKESKGEVFRKAISLYLRAKKEDNEIFLRNKDTQKVVEITGM